MIKIVPDFGIDEDTAKSQIDLIEEARITLDDSRATLGHLAEGQTPALWTADGKSVELIAALTSKYQSALKWLEAIHADLDNASANLAKAIQETTQLDEDQKATYQTLLYKAVGTVDKPIAV